MVVRQDIANITMLLSKLAAQSEATCVPVAAPLVPYTFKTAREVTTSAQVATIAIASTILFLVAQLLTWSVDMFAPTPAAAALSLPLWTSQLVVYPLMMSMAT